MKGEREPAVAARLLDAVERALGGDWEAAHRGAQRGELGVDEGAGEGHQAPEAPRGQDERRRRDLARDDVRVHEDAGADDAPHHQHRGAEQADLTGEAPARLDRCGAAHPDSAAWSIAFV